MRHGDRGLLEYRRGGAVPHPHRRGHACHRRTIAVRNGNHPRRHGQERPQGVHRRGEQLCHAETTVQPLKPDVLTKQKR